MNHNFLRDACLLLSFFLSSQAMALGNYAERVDVQQFAAQMTEKHGFNKEDLLSLFRGTRFQPAVIKAILPPVDPKVRSWRTYRARFVEQRRIANGLRFWQEHAAALDTAAQRYGVPAEIVVAIIGIETLYGRDMGKHQTWAALTTLAFDYPPRAALFRAELEELLLLAREKSLDTRRFTGSYAGALGLPQFLPSSYRRYAVDFDGDGRIELATSPHDAIGSVAHFLQQHGWAPGEKIASLALISGDSYLALADGEVKPKYTQAELAAHGISSGYDFAAEQKCALIDLVTPNERTEYWLGLQNFFAITRYNRSSFYAMSVYQLAEALRAQRMAALAKP